MGPNPPSSLIGAEHRSSWEIAAENEIRRLRKALEAAEQRLVAIHEIASDGSAHDALRKVPTE